jgi:hypothetical protein
MLRKVGVAALAALVVLTIGGQSVAKKKKPPATKLVDVGVVTGFADTLSSPTGFVDLDGASYDARAAENGTLIVRFNAESRCSGEPAAYCAVRVLVDGLEASPIDEAGTHFDATGAGGQASRSIERSFAGATKGHHDVVVQWGVFGPSSTRFDLGAWHLTVESVRPPA